MNDEGILIPSLSVEVSELTVEVLEGGWTADMVDVVLKEKAWQVVGWRLNVIPTPVKHHQTQGHEEGTWTRMAVVSFEKRS